MEGDIVILDAARRAIEKFGPRAAEVMQLRAQQHRREGDAEGERFWSRVAAAIREIAGGGTA